MLNALFPILFSIRTYRQLLIIPVWWRTTTSMTTSVSGVSIVLLHVEEIYIMGQ